MGYLGVELWLYISSLHWMWVTSCSERDFNFLSKVPPGREGWGGQRWVIFPEDISRRKRYKNNKHALLVVCIFFLRYVKTYDSICNNDNNKSNMFPSPFCNTKAYQCLSSVGIFSSVVAMFPFLWKNYLSIAKSSWPWKTTNLPLLLPLFSATFFPFSSNLSGSASHTLQCPRVFIPDSFTLGLIN